MLARRHSGLWLAISLQLTACRPDPDTRRLVSLAPSTCEAPSPAPTPLRLLTRVEYDNTVRDLLGDRVRPGTSGFPREPLYDGFDNDADSNRVTSDHIVRYLQAAEILAERALGARRDQVLGCDPAEPGCAEHFVRSFGRRAFRRPLAEAEIAGLLAPFAEGEGIGGFELGARYALETMLQSPQFLYRDERAPEDGGELDAYRLATRLSYTLWATTPDDALLDAAERGDLGDATLRRREIERLVADPRAEQGKLRYLSLWLGLEGLETLRKDPAALPSFSVAMALEWRGSLELFLRDAIARGNDLKTLLTLRSVYLTSNMQVYAPDASLAAEYRRVERPEHAGLLTQPAVLAKLAAPDQSSPVRRGVFVLDKLMCQPPPPPPNANFVPPEPNQAQTTRERFSAHETEGCATCHVRIDGIGFLFESYDGMGVFRREENGHAIDASGRIERPRDAEIAGPLEGVDVLQRRLASSGQVSDCIAQQWLRFALGRALDDGDACSLHEVQRRFADAGGSFDALLLAIADSDSFRRQVARAPEAK